MIRTLLPLGSVLALAAAACGQRNVVLCELRAEGAERWVELHNRSAATVDLSSWTLYYATPTPGQPGTYFFGFPAGSQLAAGARLLLHWRQPAPAQPPAGELWTGESAFQFLFGLGAEPLLAGGGALALVRSQQNHEMNSAALLEDWVGWGGSGLPREALAVQAGLWQSGTAAPAPGPGCSLARNEALIGLAASAAAEWFVDPTPTPLAPNAEGMRIDSLGAACAPLGNHLFGLPTLTATSAPMIGNREFALRLHNTSGLLFETVLVAFATAPAPANLPRLLPPAPGSSGCELRLDPGAVFALRWLPAQPLQTELALPLLLPPALAGLTFHVQAMVFDGYGGYLPFQGVSNALRIGLGG